MNIVSFTKQLMKQSILRNSDTITDAAIAHNVQAHLPLKELATDAVRWSAWLGDSLNIPYWPDRFNFLRL